MGGAAEKLPTGKDLGTGGDLIGGDLNGVTGSLAGISRISGSSLKETGGQLTDLRVDGGHADLGVALPTSTIELVAPLEDSV